MASNRAKAALASGIGLVAMTATYLTVPWEGVRTTAYWDSLGKVWTVCAGETKDVEKGDTYTKPQCMDMLYARMEKDYHQPLTKCIAGFDKMPLSVQGTFLDLSWNIGVSGVCNSSAAHYARAKDWVNACQAVTLYNRAGGQVVRGLDLRRKEGDASRMGEREFCREGI